MKKSKKQLQEKVLAELANGELVTALCRRDDMPPLSTLQRWRRVDTEFDDRCWSAEAQGVMIKRSAYIEQMETAIEEGGPGSAIKMQGLRDLLHENTRTAGRLVSRMSDRSHVSVDKSVQHIIVGWANGDGTVTPISDNSRQYIDRMPYGTSQVYNADG
tara:strand:+ start:102 stop:578 length:477 start_codon:yes stop_codon:yes gene_type:complete